MIRLIINYSNVILQLITCIIILQAFEIMLIAAKEGHPRAQYQLAKLYSHGKGCLRSNKLGLQWYRIAAENGNVDALRHLGDIYIAGDGVIRNKWLAMKYYNDVSSNYFFDKDDNLYI